MAIPKFLKQVSGVITEVIVGIKDFAGTGNNVVVTGDDGYISSTLFPAGLGADIVVLMTASGALVAGDLVNVFDSGSNVPKVRKADATTAGMEAHGFVDAAYSADATNVKVYFEGNNTQNSTTFSVGKQYLSTVAGKTQAAAPTGSSQVVQIVGYATSTSSLNFQSTIPFILSE
jgi:hypothetical protein